jgi:hypothetical protein
MKRTITMLAMSAMAVLLVAPAALAQDPGGLSPSGTQTPAQPYQAQPLSPMQINQGVGSIPQDATASPDATATSTASPSATASPTATASPSSTASPSATASALPDTGGPSLGTPIAVAAALVLMVSGLAVAKVAWRPNSAP